MSASSLVIRVSRSVAAIALAAVVLSGCAPAASEATPSPSAPAAPSASGTPTPEPTVEPVGAEQGFRTWLELSRIPDAPAACALMTPALIEKMLAEVAASGMPMSSCEEMIALTAEAYRATGTDAEVSIAVQEETATAATLFVTYLSSGKCGTVVMERAGDSWILTEQSEVCGA